MVPGTGATLPNGGDTNNGNPTGYLQQCSTVPSEPGLGSGVYMTIHGFRATAQKDQNQLEPGDNSITSPIFIRSKSKSKLNNGLNNGFKIPVVKLNHSHIDNSSSHHKI